MVNRSLLTQKLAELADRVARVRQHAVATTGKLRDNRDAFELVSFNLMLAVQACADIASHIITDEKWLPAASLGDSFTRLQEHSVITPDVARALRQAVGLRNIVAHGYSGVDQEAVETAANSGIEDLSHFARQVAAWATKGA